MAILVSGFDQFNLARPTYSNIFYRRPITIGIVLFPKTDSQVICLPECSAEVELVVVDASKSQTGL